MDETQCIANLIKNLQKVSVGDFPPPYIHISTLEVLDNNPLGLLDSCADTYIMSKSKSTKKLILAACILCKSF